MPAPEQRLVAVKAMPPRHFTRTGALAIEMSAAAFATLRAQARRGALAGVGWRAVTERRSTILNGDLCVVTGD
jgi:hypothetical protein